LDGEILKALPHAVAANEEAQRRFRAAALTRLPKIETMLTEVQGAQLVEFWPPGKVTDEKQATLVHEVEERISRSSHEMGIKMVNYVYRESAEPGAERKKRRRWADNPSYEI
jgi:hypothetical protein